MNTLPAFSDDQAKRTKILLAAKVASMMGRKLEEGDWSEVYCKAKNIPNSGWSNLYVDVNHNGLGIEFKMLRIAQLRGRPLKSVCGTTLMHPAATRSIRIEDLALAANEVMVNVLSQYATLIEERTQRVRDHSPDGSADMRLGWLLWEGNYVFNLARLLAVVGRVSRTGVTRHRRPLSDYAPLIRPTHTLSSPTRSGIQGCCRCERRKEQRHWILD